MTITAAWSKILHGMIKKCTAKRGRGEKRVLFRAWKIHRSWRCSTLGFQETGQSCCLLPGLTPVARRGSTFTVARLNACSVAPECHHFMRRSTSGQRENTATALFPADETSFVLCSFTWMEPRHRLVQLQTPSWVCTSTARCTPHC